MPTGFDDSVSPKELQIIQNDAAEVKYTHFPKQARLGAVGGGSCPQ